MRGWIRRMVSHDATTRVNNGFTQRHDATTRENSGFTQRHYATTNEHSCFTQRHNVFMEHGLLRYILTLWRCVDHFEDSFAISLLKQPRWITDTISSTRFPLICLVGCSPVPGIPHGRACWGTISRGNRRPTSLPAEKWRKGLRGNWPEPVR